MKTSTIVLFLAVAFFCSVSAKKSKIDWSKAKKAIPGSPKKNYHKHASTFKDRVRSEDRTGAPSQAHSGMSLKEMMSMAGDAMDRNEKFFAPNVLKHKQKIASPEMTGTNKYNKKANNPLEKQKLEIKTKSHPAHKKKHAMKPMTRRN